MGIVVGLLANILALYLANLWVAGFAVSGGWAGYIVAGLVLGILNLIVRPIFKDYFLSPDRGISWAFPYSH